jgi:hypothetical protein
VVGHLASAAQCVERAAIRSGGLCVATGSGEESSPDANADAIMFDTASGRWAERMARRKADGGGAARVERFDGFRVVEIGGGPYERGRQHGVALRDEIRLLRERLFRDIVFRRGRPMGAAFGGVLYGILARMHPHIPRELRAELRGVADGAGVPYRDVLLFNCFDDVLHTLMQLNPMLAPLMQHRFVAQVLGRKSVPAPLACSSFVLTGDKCAADGPIQGRNLDYMVHDDAIDPDNVVPKTLRETVIVFVARPDRGEPFASVAWPGFVGLVTAMNGAGLSLACMTSTVPRETPNGTPLLMLYRLVAQYARSLEEAEWMLRGARRTIGNNLSVASGPERDARLFEFSPASFAALRPREGLLRATNHFQHPRLAREQGDFAVESSRSRLRRLGEIFGEGRFGADEARAALTDTCRVAGAETDWDCLQNPGTIYGTVAEPARLALAVRAHDRPDRPWVELDLSDSLRRPCASAVA